MGDSDHIPPPDSDHPPGGRRRVYVKRGLSGSLEAVRGELARVYRDSRRGQITTGDGYKLSLILAALARIIVDSDFERRLEVLELKAGLRT